MPPLPADLFEAAFASSPQGLAVLDAEGRVRAVNARALELCGATREQMLERPLWEGLQGPRQGPLRQVIQEGLRRAVAGEPFRCTLDTGMHALGLVLTPLHGQTGHHVLASLREPELRAHVEDFLRVAPIGVFQSTPQGQYRFANPALAVLLGYDSPEELMATTGNNRIATLLYPDPAVRERLVQQACAHPGSWQSLELPFRRKDGSLVETLFTLSGQRDPDSGEILLYGYVVDLSPRRRMEASLQASHDQFERLFRIAPIGVFQSSPAGRFRFVNPAIAQILGYDSPEDLLARTEQIGIATALYPDPAVRAQIVTWLTGHPGSSQTLDHTFLRKDGSTVDTLFTMTSQVDPASGDMQLYGYVLDVSERKRMEEALRTSHLQLQSLFENAPVGMLQSTLDGQFRFVIPFLAHLLGYADATELTEAVRRKSIPEVVYAQPGARAEILEAARSSPGAWQTRELQFRRKDGEILEVFSTLTQQQDPLSGEPALYAFVVDFTAYKRMERALRLSQARLQAAFEHAPFESWTGDAEGRCLIANALATARWGIAPGLLPKDLDLPTPLKEVWMRQTRQALAGEFLQEECTYGEGSDERTCRITQVPILVDGRVQGFVGASVDLTGLRKAERERLELERRVLHAQKLESLGILAGGIAHDFNNLLTAMVGNVNLAQANATAGRPVEKHLQAVERAVAKATELTRQMLAYSGRGSFVVRLQDLNTVIREMTDLLRASISKKIRLEMELGEGLPPLEADAAQVQQVVLNLVTNASDAIGSGEGTIRMATRALDMDAGELQGLLPDATLPPGRYLELEVSDTGCGIPAELRARIFDPFFTTKHTGHGLGLAAMLGILRGHQGGLRLESEVGRGTTFHLYLPAASGQVESREEREATRALPEGSLVLLVDDEPAVRETATEALRAMKLQVLEAQDGQEAVERFQTEADRIALVVMDLTMPRMNGREAFLAIHARRPELPVLLCSGFDSGDCAQDVLGEGRAHFLQKPYTLKELRRAMAEALGS